MNAEPLRTHSRMLSDYYLPGSGVVPSDCPGALLNEGAWPEADLDGPHEVRVYRCLTCGVVVSIDATAGMLKNVYMPQRRIIA